MKVRNEIEKHFEPQIAKRKRRACAKYYWFFQLNVNVITFIVKSNVLFFYSHTKANHAKIMTRQKVAINHYYNQFASKMTFLKKSSTAV